MKSPHPDISVTAKDTYRCNVCKPEWVGWDWLYHVKCDEKHILTKLGQ